jgi:putative transposase
MPHVRLPYVIYFVTWRLHKRAVPLEPDERTVVANAINYYNEYRYWLSGYVVMDDHVHVVVRVSHTTTLQKVVQNWKSFTSHELIKVSGREGSVWQPEYFDRIIRDEEELRATLEYVANNPKKRWPDIEEYPWCRVFEI